MITTPVLYRLRFVPFSLLWGTVVERLSLTGEYCARAPGPIRPLLLALQVRVKYRQMSDLICIISM